MKSKPKICRRICLVVLVMCCLVPNLQAADYLSTGEALSIGAASTGTLLLGEHISKIPEGRKPLITGHLPFEESFQRWFGCSCKIGKLNFRDYTKGSIVTPAASALLLAGMNLRYPRDSRNRDASQDLFLFVSGIITTKGITGIAKGIFARRRPFQCILEGSVDTEQSHGHSYTQHSFFSGHASSAFFSVGYLNLRLRETMRRRFTDSEYDNWRWVSPVVLYGWASIVGLSRVHAYKHHLSDVIVGAGVGILMAELFYSLGEDSNNVSSTGSPMLLRITIPF